MDPKQILDSARSLLKHLKDHPEDLKKFEKPQDLAKSAPADKVARAKVAARRAVMLVDLVKKASEKLGVPLVKNSAPSSKIQVAKGRAARIPGDKTNRSPQGNRHASSGGASYSPRRGSGHYAAGKNENNHVMKDRNYSSALPGSKPSVTGKLSVSKEEPGMQRGRSEKEHGLMAGANMPAGQGEGPKDTAKGQSSAVKLKPKDETKRMTKDEETSLKHQQGRSESEHGMLDGKDVPKHAKPKEAKDTAKGQSTPTQLNPKDQTKQMTKDEYLGKPGAESKHDRCVEHVKENSPGVKNPHAACVAVGVRPAAWKKGEPAEKCGDSMSYKKSGVYKDDKPHPPESPEDSAHDVKEEGKNLGAELRSQPADSRARVLAHLRTLKDAGKLRSPANRAAGKD
jgi:hypothetical protein